MQATGAIVRRVGVVISHARFLTGGALAGARRHIPGDSVALTFDDGPHPGTTDRVLDILSELKVQATFFCVGRNAKSHPQLVRRALTEGHGIGSHSYSHPYAA